MLPQNELPHHIKGLLRLFSNISLKHFYDEKGNQTTETASEDDKQKYIDSLPNFGIEISVLSKSVSDGVNICLLKRIKQVEIEAKLLLAIQMKWHTIIIPILSDDYVSGEVCKIGLINSDNIALRKLDFSKMENEFICVMAGDLIEIQPGFYEELKDDLRNSGLLKKHMNK